MIRHLLCDTGRQSHRPYLFSNSIPLTHSMIVRASPRIQYLELSPGYGSYGHAAGTQTCNLAYLQHNECKRTEMSHHLFPHVEVVRIGQCHWSTGLRNVIFIVKLTCTRVDLKMVVYCINISTLLCKNITIIILFK